MANKIRATLRGDRRSGRRLTLWCACVLSLMALLALNLWSKPAPQQNAGGLPLAALRTAYSHIVPGETQARDLAKLGFDVARPGVKRLSYLSLMEGFAPRDSSGFDRLDAAAAKCLGTPNGCSAYVFRLARVPGSESQASFSFIGPAEAEAPNVEILLLIHDGCIAYKAINGV